MTEDGEMLFNVNGRSDVSRDNEIWELKFVQELSHIHALLAGSDNAFSISLSIL